MSLGQLVVELSLDGKEFTVNLLKADGLMENFVKRAEGASKVVQRVEHHHRSLGRTIRDTVITLGLMESALHMIKSATIGWQQSIIKVNDDVQRSILLMKNFSKETDSAAATQEAFADVQMLMDKATKAPFSLDAITDSFVKLQVAGIQPVDQSLNSLIDSVAAFGGSNENLKRASVAIQQMAGKGVVSMEELRQQLGEAVPTAIQNMADGLGVSYAKLVKEISLGRVKSEPALIAMMREMELSFKGSAERMMMTWGGAVARFETEAKKLALAVGGLNEKGYAEDSYMGTLTAELNRLSDLMSDPTIIAAAKDFGQALATMVKAASDSVHWIAENRAAIADWGKAALTVIVALKGMSIIRSFTEQAGLGILAVAKSLDTTFNSANKTAGALQKLNPSIAAGTAEWAKKNGAVGLAGKTLGVAGGALAALTGPLGMVAMALGSTAYAWWEHQKSVDANIQSLIRMKGVMAGAAEMALMQERVADNNEKIAGLQRDNRIAAGEEVGALSWLSKGYINVAGNQQEILKLQQENARLAVSIAGATSNIANQAVQDEVNAANASIRDGQQKIQKEYVNSLDAWREEIKKKDALSGEAQKQRAEELAKQKTDIELKQLQAQYDLKAGLIEKLEGEIAAKQTTGPNGEVIKFDQKEIDAKTGAVERLRSELGATGDDIFRIMESTRTMADTVMLGASGGAAGAAAKFNPFSKFMDGLSVKVAKAGAVFEEANPHIAEMRQILENMAADGIARPAQAEIDAAMRLAAARWEQEKAIKALKQANTDYQDSADRIAQIDRVMTAKLSKVENNNPWLNASADAVRYQEELDDLKVKLEQARKAASENAKVSPVDAQRIQADITATEAGIESLMEKIDRLSVTDAAKDMTNKTKELRDSLATERQLIDSQYQYDIDQAQEYYNRHREELENNKSAYYAYYAYVEALRDRYARDTESGLQEWIRENRDASEEYKSLWKSAMDGFVDLVADGLMEGKFEISQFVEYVAKEMLKIQIAKATAGIGDAIIGSVGSAIGGFFGGGATPGSSAGDYTSVDLSNFSPKASTFANGGIMTEYGKAALKKYANGGIANSPQIALYGEGSKPEAYVPLPDGRTIPVTLSGLPAGGGGGSANVNVNVNVIEGEGTKATVKQTPDGNGGMNIDVIVEQIEGKMSQNIAKGRSSVGQVLERTYGLNRAAGAVR